MIYLLTAIGLSPGGISTVHIYTYTIHRTTQLTTEQQQFIYFTNDRYIDSLSLTYVTNKSKTKKKQKKGNIQGKYEVLMLRSSHKKIVIIK